jgi:2,3-bisphosphoglycerate-independent phosphoglycerate mutase
MNKKVVLLILDGLGINKNTEGNAVALANTPNLDKLMNVYPNTQLEASGKGVGLPDGQMGNSEVGHLNIGAGRVVYTGLSIINNAIETGKFNSNKSFNQAIDHVNKNNSKLHLISLVSDGGVHASWEHLVALIKMCKNINAVMHVVTDGRDVAPKSATEYLSKLIPILKENNVKLGSIGGRYFTMDRDKN